MYQELQDLIRYVFRDPTLLVEALTHRSFCPPDSGTKNSHNERLEFLGDAVLGLVVSESVTERFPQFTEGDLSKIKAQLISRTTLARAAQRMEVGKWLRLGRGEERTRGREKPSLLANALEAILGAVYVDGGLEAARVVVRRVLGPELATLREGRSRSIKNDYKTRLQEWAHQSGCSPGYRVIGELGPDHEKTFLVEVVMNNQVLGAGKGRTKKEAEQQAAQQALKRAEEGVQ